MRNRREKSKYKPLIQKIESLIDISFRGCHNKYFHTFDDICECDIQLTKLIIMKQLI